MTRTRVGLGFVSAVAFAAGGAAYGQAASGPVFDCAKASGEVQHLAEAYPP